MVVADKNGPEEWHGVEGQRFLGFRKGGVAELAFKLDLVSPSKNHILKKLEQFMICYVYFLVQ